MTKKSTDIKYYEAIGRRKTSVARVRLYIGATKLGNHDLKKGDVVVNSMPASGYFPGVVMKSRFHTPIEATENIDRFGISIIARGGGINGQLEASILGIARALEIVDKDNRAILKPLGLLSRDSRARERRKPGTGGRARRQKQSPKR